MRARICSAFSCDVFARVVWLKPRGAAKLPTCTINLCRTHSPRTARATNSCTPHGGSQGGRRESSLLTFAALLVTQKRDKGKVSLIKRLLIRHALRATFSHRRRLPIRFFFCHRRRKRKSYQKEKRREEISRSAERDKGSACPRLGDANTHASHMC